MADDGTINLDESGNIGDYVIFSHCGKTMIGKLFPKMPKEQITGTEAADGSKSGAIQFVMIDDESDYYWIANPAQIEFNLDIPSSGDADLKWKITPVFFPDLVASTKSIYDTIYVSYPKASVALTNIGGTVINSVIKDAYKELCE